MLEWSERLSPNRDWLRILLRQHVAPARRDEKEGKKQEWIGEDGEDDHQYEDCWGGRGRQGKRRHVSRLISLWADVFQGNGRQAVRCRQGEYSAKVSSGPGTCVISLVVSNIGPHPHSPVIVWLCEAAGGAYRIKRYQLHGMAEATLFVFHPIVESREEPSIEENGEMWMDGDGDGIAHETGALHLTGGAKQSL